MGFRPKGEGCCLAALARTRWALGADHLGPLALALAHSEVLLYPRLLHAVQGLHIHRAAAPALVAVRASARPACEAHEVARRVEAPSIAQAVPTSAAAAPATAAAPAAPATPSFAGSDQGFRPLRRPRPRPRLRSRSPPPPPRPFGPG